ncbi:MAG: hypothetical protein U5R31_06970 [Acidimicrobiia bacterium]|nr:hypothetical protein [Acidimicrobiia bacterium]
MTTAGIGEISWEMTVDEAQQAAGARLLREDGGSDECYTAVPEDGPEGVTFLVADGEVQRVEVTNEAIRTPSGAGVGIDEDELRALFPERLETTPGGGGNVLAFVPNSPGEAQWRIVFETDGSEVTSYRAGRLPWVERAGC